MEFQLSRSLFLKVSLVTSRLAALWECTLFFSYLICPSHTHPAGIIFSVMQIGQLFTFFLSLNSTSTGTQMHFGSHSCRKITGNLMNLQVILQKCLASFAKDVWPQALLRWCKFLSVLAWSDQYQLWVLWLCTSDVKRRRKTTYSKADLKVCELGQKWDCRCNWSMPFNSAKLLFVLLSYLIVP